MDTSISIVAYLGLFAAAGFAFVLLNLVIGRFLRPANPHPEKQEVYECGEPTIGSSFIQFDLRFYVVALVFIVFDVEVAFMFPWATVYGKATQLMRVADDNGPLAAEDMSARRQAAIEGLYRELGVAGPVALATSASQTMEEVQSGARQLVALSAVTMVVFFFVLLLGFAYEWKTGAMDWVRVITRPDTASVVRAPPAEVYDEEAVISV